MNKIVGNIGFLVISIMILIIISSCDENIDVIARGSSLPVVYGLLNPDDTINYIRLTKTFIGNEPVRDLASRPENLFYQDVSMTLDINSPEGYPMGSFPFEKVVLPDRIEGLFLILPKIRTTG